MILKIVLKMLRSCNSDVQALEAYMTLHAKQQTKQGFPIFQHFIKVKLFENLYKYTFVLQTPSVTSCAKSLCVYIPSAPLLISFSNVLRIRLNKFLTYHLF